jgi:hypothetical protein
VPATESAMCSLVITPRIRLGRGTHSLESGVQALLQSLDYLHDLFEGGDWHHLIGDLVSAAGGDQAQDVVLGLGVVGVH